MGNSTLHVRRRYRKAYLRVNCLNQSDSTIITSGAYIPAKHLYVAVHWECRGRHTLASLARFTSESQLSWFFLSNKDNIQIERVTSIQRVLNMTVRLVIISDTHDQLNQIVVPAGDILIHCGDFSRNGSVEELERFNRQFAQLPHQFKLLVAGNHDHLLLNSEGNAQRMFDRTINYLEDTEIELGGLKFFGSPWRNRLLHHPPPQLFNLPEWTKRVFPSREQKNVWTIIPEHIDVLITHGPPHKILDRTPLDHNVGCELLRMRVDFVRPRLHCFGHIHHSYGYEQTASTLFINAANLDESYRPVNKPIVVEIDSSTMKVVDDTQH